MTLHVSPAKEAGLAELIWELAESLMVIAETKAA